MPKPSLQLPLTPAELSAADALVAARTARAAAHPSAAAARAALDTADRLADAAAATGKSAAAQSVEARRVLRHRQRSAAAFVELAEALGAVQPDLGDHARPRLPTDAVLRATVQTAALRDAQSPPRLGAAVSAQPLNPAAFVPYAKEMLKPFEAANPAAAFEQPLTDKDRARLFAKAKSKAAEARAYGRKLRVKPPKSAAEVKGPVAEAVAVATIAVTDGTTREEADATAAALQAALGAAAAKAKPLRKAKAAFAVLVEALPSGEAGGAAEANTSQPAPLQLRVAMVTRDKRADELRKTLRALAEDAFAADRAVRHDVSSLVRAAEFRLEGGMSVADLFAPGASDASLALQATRELRATAEVTANSAALDHAVATLHQNIADRFSDTEDIRKAFALAAGVATFGHAATTVTVAPPELLFAQAVRNNAASMRRYFCKAKPRCGSVSASRNAADRSGARDTTVFEEFTARMLSDSFLLGITGDDLRDLLAYGLTEAAAAAAAVPELRQCVEAAFLCARHCAAVTSVRAASPLAVVRAELEGAEVFRVLPASADAAEARVAALLLSAMTAEERATAISAAEAAASNREGALRGELGTARRFVPLQVRRWFSEAEEERDGATAALVIENATGRELKKRSARTIPMACAYRTSVVKVAALGLASAPIRRAVCGGWAAPTLVAPGRRGAERLRIAGLHPNGGPRLEVFAPMEPDRLGDVRRHVAVVVDVFDCRSATVVKKAARETEDLAASLAFGNAEQVAEMSAPKLDEEEAPGAPRGVEAIPPPAGLVAVRLVDERNTASVTIGEVEKAAKARFPRATTVRVMTVTTPSSGQSVAGASDSTAVLDAIAEVAATVIGEKGTAPSSPWDFAFTA